MFLLDTTILAASSLLLLGIASSKFSARLGMPVLVMFLGLGMLAGSEGLGGIAFEDYSFAYGIGTLALALILFSGGLGTPYKAVRATWKPAGLLATVGVLITAVVTGVAASYILEISLAQGLLLGSIVGSTDAAAVFSILRSGGVHIRRRLADTLEVESGSNDPMAIFMTVGLIEVLTGNVTPGIGLAGLFFNQMLVGLAVGIGIGLASVWVLKHIHLGAAGLYPVLATACGLFSYGLAADLGGSGFLATYLTGMVIGNHRVVFHRGIVLFHDAAAWLGQIVMFIMLGMLSFPSRLLDVFVPGLAIAVVLVFVARPLAVVLNVFPFRFSFREQVFLSWVGLKGAVPITLATFPLLAGIPSASLIFDVVFFVVLVSAIVQGWSLPWVARRLRLETAPTRQAPVTLEISSLHDIEGDIVDYYVAPEARAAGKLVKELALPEDVVIALIVREHQIRMPKGSSRIEAEDHVVVVLRPGVRPLVDRVFAPRAMEGVEKELPRAVEFPLRGNISVRELEEFYQLSLGGDASITLDKWFRERVGGSRVSKGMTVNCDRVRLRAVEVAANGHIQYLGMTILPEGAPDDEAVRELPTESLVGTDPATGEAASMSVPASDSAESAGSPVVDEDRIARSVAGDRSVQREQES
ncbi:MAG: potassium/proton antiporter [Planctomycetaceae bacterium]|nr:MAG: potassium/proton antiporter [Planctomycetaceae bacterium]